MTSQPQPIGSTQPISMHVSYQSHFVNYLTIVWTGFRGKMNMSFLQFACCLDFVYIRIIFAILYIPPLSTGFMHLWSSDDIQLCKMLRSSIALVNISFRNLITKPVLSWILGEIDICITSIFNSLKNFNNRNQFIW